MLSATRTIGIEGFFARAEDDSGGWGEPGLGEEWTVRVFGAMYF